MRALGLAVVLLATSAFAQPPAENELRQLQAQLAAIYQEQQSVFQQFQMLQALRRDELQALNPQVIQNSPVYSSDNPPPNYDDIVRDRAAREERLRQYASDSNALYARYQALEQEKQPVLARLRELAQQKN